MLISLRFLCSGVILIIAAVLLKATLPRGRELRLTALYGLIALGGGNGALIFAETWIASGTAALIITLGAFWMVGIEALLPGGERLHMPALGGIVLGFFGILILFAPVASGTLAGPALIKGFLLLQFGSVCWALGSLLQRRLATRANPVVSGAVQQLAVGLAALPWALTVPEHPVHWSTRGVLAAAWLVVFGSIIGYSAFIYAMERLPVAIVSTYTYVNPVVAVTLGWLFYREPFGWRELVAMIFVFTGVAVVKYFAGGSRKMDRGGIYRTEPQQHVERIDSARQTYDT